MSRRSIIFCPLVALALIAVVGCHPQQPFYFGEDGDLSHYLGEELEIDYPDVETEGLDDVDKAIRPFSLSNSEPQEICDISLAEAIQNALANSKVMRSIGGQIQGPPDFLVRNPELAPTVYGPAITESNPRFGVEAALAAFDARLTSSVFWEKNDTPRNTFVFGDQPLTAFPSVLKQDLGTFQAAITKTAATGTTWTMRHNVRYDKQNASRLFLSDWNVNLEAEMRHPLLQGCGVQFNRIAGPGAIPGFNNGVMIARINTDVALADFEAGVRNLVSDVEAAYWEVYFAYRNLDTVIAGRDSALATWRRVHALYVQGAKGGEAAQEAQAREQYFLFRSTVERALNSLYQAESKLRYMMGLASTDGRLFRPADEPTTAKVTFDWYEALAESLCRNVELREQKWIVKRRELELIASKNFLKPRVDAVARYRWLGLGDDLINANNTTGNLSQNAYENMTSGRHQEWQLGIEATLPIGLRKEHSGVRFAQLNLAQERAKLQEQELELSHQLAYAIRELEAQQVLMQTNFNRRVAAQRQVDAVTTAYETGTITLDQVLDAQRLLAQAQSDYFRSVVDYNKAITQVHYRKGSLLEYNRVHLKEGPWPAKAYFDAHGRARQRDASVYLDYGFTRPKVISRGPVNQHAGASAGMSLFGGGEDLSELETLDAGEMAPELIPTPAPEPTGGELEGIDGLKEPPAPTPIDEPMAGANRSDPNVVSAIHRGDRSSRPASRWNSRPRPDGPMLTAAQSGTGWSRSARSSAGHESVANSSSAGTNWSAPGWTGLQR